MDDDKIEPMDIYQLMIVNFSDPRAMVGDVDATYIIVMMMMVRCDRAAIYVCNILLLVNVPALSCRSR